MITERDLEEAIAECRGKRNPDSGTCVKLAAFYILRDHLYPEEPQEALGGHSYASGLYDSGTEFSQAIQGLSADDMIPVFDELMEALSILNPKLYQSVLRKLKDI